MALTSGCIAKIFNQEETGSSGSVVQVLDIKKPAASAPAEEAPAGSEAGDDA